MQEKQSSAGRGGTASIIRLPEVPVMEREITVGPQAAAALDHWDPRPGEIYTLAGPDGHFYRGRLTRFDGETADLVVFHRFPGPVESPVSFHLFQAVPEKERFELILQKATELGVHRICPFSSARSTTLEERERGQKKSHRWPHVLKRAARQCRRAMIPELSAPLTWEQMLREATRSDLTLLLYERENACGLNRALEGFSGSSISIVIGPEGGLTVPESRALVRAGGRTVTLGSRILRTETAAITALGLIQLLTGGME